MNIDLYHIKLKTLQGPDGYQFLLGQRIPKADELENVAKVNVTDIKDVFPLTNDSWTSNPGVTLLLSDSPYRSTSVGDVYHNPATDEWFVVAPSSIKPIASPFDN